MGIAFLLLYGGCSRLTELVPWRFDVALPFEAGIPFVAEASFVYLSIDLALLLAPFVFRDARSLFPLWSVLMLQTAIAAPCFLLFPIATAPAPQAPGGLTGWAYALADGMNLSNNFLPSLHVSYAFTLALFFGETGASQSGETPHSHSHSGDLVGRSRRRLARSAWLLWATAVAASTLLLHAHFLADVIAGIALAWVTRSHVGAFCARAEVQEGFAVDLHCLELAIPCVRRHRRYLTIVLALIASGLLRWRSRRVLRTGFVFLQVVDDWLDGDRSCSEPPLGMSDRLIAGLRSGSFGSEPIEAVADSLRRDLIQLGGMPLVERVCQLIRVMQIDLRRRDYGLLFSGVELRAHHRATFELSLELMLEAMGAEIGPHDVPELIDAFAWCSTWRDLHEDLAHGLVNVPREVFERVEPSAWREGRWMHAAPVIEWCERERELACENLDRTAERLARLRGRKGVRVLAMFARSIRGYTRRPMPGSVSESVAGIA